MEIYSYKLKLKEKENYCTLYLSEWIAKDIIKSYIEQCLILEL